MSTGQEWVNRSHGQRHRRAAERMDQIEAQLAANQAQTAQAQRDIKMTKARLSAVEQAKQQQNR